MNSFRVILFLGLAAVLPALAPLNAAVRYVSKTGSSTAPYLTWETASDSIQKCIRACQPGDTIYVAKGNYKEQVDMIPRLTLIGAGMDSTTLDVSQFTGNTLQYPCVVLVRDSCTVKGFTLWVRYGIDQWAIYMGFWAARPARGFLVADNRAVRADQFIAPQDGVIRNNITTLTKNIIMPGINTETNSIEVYNNLFSFRDAFYWARSWVGGTTTFNIHNNILISDTRYSKLINNGTEFNSTLNFNNNIVLGLNDNPLHKADEFIATSWNSTYRNNLFMFPTEELFSCSGTTTVVNNIIMNADSAIYTSRQYPATTVKYNAFFNCKKRYASTYTNPLDSTNITADPMFVNDAPLPEYGGDYRLQLFSPLINRGDPAILDVDGSRSDIGPYGGPGGMLYPYTDYPPRVPVRVTAYSSHTAKFLAWGQNTEADFDHFKVYAARTPNFTADSSTLLMVTRDTLLPLRGVVDSTAPRLYFKIRAVDRQGLLSPLSQEVNIIIAGSGEEGSSGIDVYQLFDNYPNPFNPATTIAYNLAKEGYVKVSIYDLKGELVQYAVNGVQAAGYHEAEVRGLKRQEGVDKLASGIYLYRIDVTDPYTRHPVFSDMKKMVLIK